MQQLTPALLMEMAPHVKMERVELPEWDSFVYVREMSVRDRDALDESSFHTTPNGTVVRDMTNYRARFVVRCACDETGSLIFKPEHAEKLGEMAVSTVNKIFEAGRKINGIAVEVLEKNSEETSDDNSVSD